MNFDYKPTRTLTTGDLPGVYCDPPISFEFLMSPPMAVSSMMIMFDRAPTDEMLKALAAGLIVSVINHEGTRYEMGSVDNIEAFIEATSRDFLEVVIRSWGVLNYQEREAAKKKSPPLATRSASTPPKNSRQKQSSAA